MRRRFRRHANHSGFLRGRSINSYMGNVGAFRQRSSAAPHTAQITHPYADQELLFSPSVLGAAIALNDCHHPRNMRLGLWMCHRDRQQKHGPRWGDSPTCQMILNIIGDLLTNRCQLKQFVFGDGIVCLFGLLPVHVRLVPQIVRPIHATRSVKKLSIRFYLLPPPKVSSLAPG